LETVEFSDFVRPLVGNTEATVMEKERVKELLTRQVMEPVRFYDSIAKMQEAGVTEFIEIGPGKVLSGFIKKIDKSADVRQVEDVESLNALLEK
jgi:malonyl-coA:ACP transacylase, putative